MYEFINFLLSNKQTKLCSQGPHQSKQGVMYRAFTTGMNADPCMIRHHKPCTMQKASEMETEIQ